MAGRIEVGSAEFNLLMNNEQFKQAFEQSEREAKTRSGNIATTVAEANKKISANADALVQHEAQAAKKVQQEWAKAASAIGVTFEQASGRFKRNGLFVSEQQVSQEIARIKRIQDAADAAARKAAEQAANRGGAGPGISQAFAFGAGAVGVGSAVTIAHNAVSGVIDATKEAEQARFALARTYGSTAEDISKFASDEAAAVGRSTTEYQKAFVAVATLAKNYGATAEEQKELLKRTTDLAAVHGLSLPDAAKRAGDALRGEAEASELLGVSLQSDVVKATADMTQAQRKSWETLDATTKRQITFREFLKQTADAQGAATDRANSSLGAFDRFNASIEKLSANLGQFLLPGLADLVTKLNQIIEAGPKAAAALREATGGGSAAPPPHPPTQGEQTAGTAGGALAGGLFGGVAGSILGGPPGAAIGAAAGSMIGGFVESQRLGDQVKKIAADQAFEEKVRGQAKQDQDKDNVQAARTAALAEVKVRQDAAKAIAEHETGIIQGRKDAIESYDRERRQQINDQKDFELRALADRTQATLDGIATERQATADYYASAIKGAEVQRDAEKRAAEERRDAALQGIESEQRALEQARTNEDRTREDAQTRTIRGIEAQHDAAIRNLDSEKLGIESKRDTALRAIDEELAAEDRRHNEVLDNLKQEERQRLGVIDDQLKAIDQQERAERNAETDRRLQESLSSARQGLRSARKAGDPNAIRSAQKAVADAERAIEQESRSRQRDAARESLRDQQDAIREEFAARRDAEQKQNDDAKTQLAERKDQLEQQTAAELQAIEDRRAAEGIAHEERMQLARDAFEQETRLLQDRRTAEDQALEDRKQAVAAAYQAEQEQIRQTYDDESTGLIPALRRQAEAAEREYQRQTVAVQRESDAQRQIIQQTAERELQVLSQKTQQAQRLLDQETNGWKLWEREIALILKQAEQDIDLYINKLYSIPSPSSILGLNPGGINAQGGVGTPTVNLPGGNPTTSGAYNKTATQTQTTTKAVIPGINDVENYLLDVGFQRGTEEFIRESASLWDELHHGYTVPTNWKVPITGFREGGWIREPTWLMSQRSGAIYGQAGEAGSEYVGPVHNGSTGAGRGGAAITLAITNHINGANIGDPNQLAEVIVDRSVEKMSELLLHVQGVMPDPANPDLPGAESVW